MRFLLAALLCAGSLLASGEHSGRRAPGFALPDGSFNYYDLQDFRGKILILDFMSTNCPNCATLSGVLEKVKAKYGDKVAVLSVVNSRSDNQNTVARYAAAHKVTGPIVFDSGQVAASYLKITPQRPSFSVPYIFVIDQQGIIRHDYGYNLLSKDIFEGSGLFPVIDRMLAGGAAPAKKK
jgi:cytochrome c biogenesis protein CcmG, thiol:disulfide interchange protein DsbE